MKLKTPAFWYKNSPSGVSAALTPFSCLYALGRTYHKTLAKPYESKVPVLCIGNIIAGGSGKTPTALALLALVRELGLSQSPVFLTRGYGGRLKGPVFVGGNHKSGDVGDEALLLAKAERTIVSADRAAGAVTAEESGADLIIMDDGLQNPTLKKDIRIIVIDGASGFGNGKLLPAGPLREPLHKGLRQAHGFILIGEDKTGVIDMLPTDKPVFLAEIEVPKEARPKKKARYVAFAGLAHPDKFRRTLEACGADLAGWHVFPDHYAYNVKDMKRLAEDARGKNARLITTEKDAVRLSGMDLPEELDVLPVRLQWTSGQSPESFLKFQMRKSN